MPLDGGNELSFFSISLTICFYLVINGSRGRAAGRGQCSLSLSVKHESTSSRHNAITQATAWEYYNAQCLKHIHRAASELNC